MKFRYRFFSAAVLAFAVLGAGSFSAYASEEAGQAGSFRMTARTVGDSLQDADESGTADTARKRFPAGKYKIGDDMPKGEYILFAYGGKSTLLIGTTEAGTYSVSVDQFTYNHIAVFEDGQNITLNSCYALPVNLIEPEYLNLAGPGMYKAGMHISPGNYTLVPEGDEGGSYTIYSTISPEKIYAEGDVTGNVTIRLSAGQYIDLRGCRFSTVPAPVMITFTDKETIRRVQAQLNMIKYDCGKPDGVAGAKTTAAIKKFQEDHQLTVNGKVTKEFLLSLDQESPWSEAEKEAGPFITDAAQFVSRYHDALEKVSETEDASYAEISAADIEKGDTSPNGQGSYAFETNHAADKIRSAFYIQNGSYDRSSVIELALFMYALDTSFKDFDSANTAALKFLFDGKYETASLTYSMLDINGAAAAWGQLK